MLSKLAAPIAAAAFMAVTAQPAKADCFYMEGGPEAGFPKTPLPAFSSMASGDDEILGSTIPVSGRALSEKESEDLGNLMNFACLYRPDINRIYPEQEFAPSNIRDISLARALVQSMSDNQYPLRFNFRERSGEQMSADINCNTITLNFNPDTFTNTAGTEDEKTERFMGTVISLLASAYRNRPNFVGHYEIGADYTARPSFRQDRTNTCAAQIS